MAILPSVLKAGWDLEPFEHAEVLATAQGLTELSFLIGLASIAANDIVEGSATGLDP